ncbi:MAG: Lrp/AsnC family transcriptional regulator [Actinomycetota bacterium]|nr:Lrp/AsnC family transcriptional regulator [Actinomycetota bacterium]
MEPLDDVDRMIVGLLCQEGRMSFTDVAKATGLSTSAAHQRVRRLEQRQVVTGYRAVVDPEAVGLPLTAFVSCTPIDPADPDDLPQRVAGVAAVESCYSVAGDHNYVLVVRVAAPSRLETLLQEIRTLGNVSTRTTVVLSTPYEGRPPAL